VAAGDHKRKIRVHPRSSASPKSAVSQQMAQVGNPDLGHFV